MAPTRTPALVCVGVAALDALALVDGLPGPDERVVADDVAFAGGGPAATAAVAAARLGADVAFVGAVGEDEDGARVRSGLLAEGIDVSGLQAVPGRTGASVVLVDRTAGTRVIANRPGPALQLAPGSRGDALVRAAAWVHVDQVGWAAVDRALAGVPRTDRPRLSVDAGNPIEGFTPAGVDLYVPTLEALARLYGPQDPDALLEAALRAGAEAVVATRGGAGSVAATRDGLRCSAPASRSTIVSTLGAGDVFHGALLAAVLEGLPLDRALPYANAAAAASCAGLDGRSAIPDRASLDALLPAVLSAAHG